MFRHAYSQAYRDLSERALRLRRLFYEGTNVSDPEWVEITYQLRSLVKRPGGNYLTLLIKRFALDAIVCTHFLPIELLVRLKW